jgi:carboxypeptidase T
MKKIFMFAIICLSTQLVGATPPPEALYWMRLSAKTAAERTVIAEDLAIEIVNAEDVVAVGTKAELDAQLKAGRVLSHYEIPLETLDFPSEDEKFQNYDEMTKALKTIAQLAPGLTTLTSIGKTVEGRDIWMLSVGLFRNDRSVPAVLFVGGHHAREHISMETPFFIAQELISKYAANDPYVVSLLDTRTAHFIPMLNGDGTEHDISTGSYKMWRKNRTRNSDGSYGVDLNRNYDHQFGTVGSSSNPRSEVYHGQKGFSEPETRAIRDFLISNSNVSIVQSYHTFSELILYPWGYTNTPIANAPDFKLHKTMADEMAKWNGYTVQQSSELYLTSGDTCDWAYGALGVVCFTFELDPKSQWDGGFYPGQDMIEVVFRKNWQPALYLLENAASPYRALEKESAKYGVGSLGW